MWSRNGAKKEDLDTESEEQKIGIYKGSMSPRRPIQLI
jgi:hypothetical protein